MQMPNIGETVHVWPTLPNVQDGAGNWRRFLRPEGRAVVLDDYWTRRLLDGSVSLTDPRPKGND